MRSAKVPLYFKIPKSTLSVHCLMSFVKAINNRQLWLDLVSFLIFASIFEEKICGTFSSFNIRYTRVDMVIFKGKRVYIMS